MVEDIHNKVTHEMSKERRDREETEASLLKLLEETCARVERSIVS
jgi:hypothetical protein